MRNGQKSIPGVFALFLTTQLQVGTEAEDTLSLDLHEVNAESLGVKDLSLLDQTGATSGIDQVRNAITTLSGQRANLGAMQNRLEHKLANLNNVIENTTYAESRIRDTDMATTMVKFSNSNILSQVGQAMLAQANQSKNGLLALLG